MEISETESSKLMDGYVFSIILRTFLKNKNDEERIKKIDSLKENSTPAIRLYNWGIISDILKHLGFNLETVDKSKITNYDP